MLYIRTETGQTALPYRRGRKGITFEVRVQPRSSKLCIEGVSEGVLRVRLTAPPAEGAANAQLVKLLAEELGVRKSSITIIKGETSRNKVVEVSDL